MSSSRQFLIEGIDPTSVPNFTVADLLPFIRGVAPASDVGFVILADNPPDVVTYPELARFLWIKTDPASLEDLGAVFWHNGVSWQRIRANINIPDGAVSISKLSTEGGNAKQVPAIKPDLSEFYFSDVVDLIEADSLEVDRLKAPTTNAFLGYLDGSIGWKSVIEIVDAIADGTFIESKLSIGSEKQVLATVGSVTTWANIVDLLQTSSIPLTKLYFGTTVLSYAGVININASLSSSFYLELLGNVSDFSISNLVNGATINVVIKQDSVGGRTVTFSSDIKWPNSAPPAITSTPNHADFFSFSKVNGTIYAVRAPNYTP